MDVLFLCPVMPKRSKRLVEALQEQAQALFNQGCSQSEVAKILGVSVRTLQRWNQVAPSRGEPIATDFIATAVSSPEQFESESIQQKVVEMFKSGLEPSVIAKKLGLPTNTVNRWITASESTCLPEEFERAILDLPTEKQSFFVTKFDKTLEVEEIERALAEHQKCHQLAWLKLDELFHKELAKSEPSIRNLRFLSQEVARRINGEREALNVDQCQWFKFDRALMLFKAYGYGVINISAIEQYEQRQED